MLIISHRNFWTIKNFQNRGNHIKMHYWLVFTLFLTTRRIFTYSRREKFCNFFGLFFLICRNFCTYRPKEGPGRNFWHIFRKYYAWLLSVPNFVLIPLLVKKLFKPVNLAQRSGTSFFLSFHGNKYVLLS